MAPGDLVFYHSPVSQVGIYVGNSQITHASTYWTPVALASVSGGGSYNSARSIVGAPARPQPSTTRSTYDRQNMILRRTR